MFCQMPVQPEDKRKTLAVQNDELQLSEQRIRTRRAGEIFIGIKALPVSFGQVAHLFQRSHHVLISRSLFSFWTLMEQPRTVNYLKNKQTMYLALYLQLPTRVLTTCLRGD